MKTSFYFVVWILIYPILELTGNNYISQNSFVCALALVWGLSWLLNRMMPNTLIYDYALNTLPIMEDVYTGNVTSFKKRLTRESWVETITSIYFCISTAVIAMAIFIIGISDWIALVIFVFLSIGSITRSAKLIKARFSLKAEPTPERCMYIAEETYQLNNADYYEGRQEYKCEEMLQPRPRFFKAYLWFSIVMATIAALLGLLLIIAAAVIMIINSDIEAWAYATMVFLYGSLAAYFGVKDFVTTLQTLRNKLIKFSTDYEKEQ